MPNGRHQEIALFLLPYHMTSGVFPSHKSADTEYPVVAIENNDLQPLSPDIVYKLKKIDIKIQ